MPRTGSYDGSSVTAEPAIDAEGEPSCAGAIYTGAPPRLVEPLAGREADAGSLADVAQHLQQIMV